MKCLQCEKSVKRETVGKAQLLNVKSFGKTGDAAILLINFAYFRGRLEHISYFLCAVFARPNHCFLFEKSNFQAQ